ncbi:hypothetical protein GmHk_06G015243 [Glycine max]|nr:hypothetical protein GmHk_06G015243 [Glycine max]
MSRCVSCGSGSALIHNKNLLISPIHNALKVRGNNRSCGLRVQVSMVDSSSADFTRRIERAWSISKKIGYQGVYNNSFAPGQPADNQGQSCVRLATQKGILNVNGVRVLVFLFLVITCFVKSHPETLPALFALERDRCAVLIVKEQAFVQSGWENLLLPSTKATTQMVEHHGLEAVKNVVILLYSTSFYMCLTDANNL